MVVVVRSALRAVRLLHGGGGVAGEHGLEVAVQTADEVHHLARLALGVGHRSEQHVAVALCVGWVEGVEGVCVWGGVRWRGWDGGHSKLLKAKTTQQGYMGHG